jgi:hypothetical protein
VVDSPWLRGRTPTRCGELNAIFRNVKCSICIATRPPTTPDTSGMQLIPTGSPTCPSDIYAYSSPKCVESKSNPHARMHLHFRSRASGVWCASRVAASGRHCSDDRRNALPCRSTGLKSSPFPAVVWISMQSSGNGVDYERNGRDLLRAVGPMLANRPYRCEIKYRYSISVKISGG